MAAALLLSLYAFSQLLGLPAEEREHTVRVAHVDLEHPARSCRTAPSARSPSRGASGSTRSPAMMILVVTGIGFLIHVYSTATCTGSPEGRTRGSSRT